ncbi:glycosyltransferase family 4 protein [Flavobacterium sp. GSA192]|uniref:glycosyltransferase family 4 protein n=1 Tax=Flavobacterium sp. GSA192 TaxID=2576304 RepID=UPI0011268B34|nr:glycosyltransferase family 4 protein [Flavobacterium sp. GSA192]
MRILQLIDSLEAGGAERMAVNYANALAAEIEFSALVATRKEGSLKKQLLEKAAYLFLNKKSTLDCKAVFQLRNYIIQHQIQIIQAHSSSFFLAVLVKLTLPKIKIIWHDHYGNSAFLEKRPHFFLQIGRWFFSGIIAVNENLQSWSKTQLHFKNVIYLPNFAMVESVVERQTFLKGESGKRIVCLANLRQQKNHFLLLDVASSLRESHPDWSFHLLGKDFKDDYSEALKEELKSKQLENHVFVYDSGSDVAAILAQVQIGVLTSNSEGLPVALLEYGLHQKAVVVTQVGQVAAVIADTKNGFLVPPNDRVLFYNRLVELIDDRILRERFSENLHQTVVEHFSEASSIKKYIHWIRTTINE